MIRATTPKQSFKFHDINPEEFKSILITYAQGDTIVLEKEKGDLTFEEIGEDEHIAWFRMTQEEANLFRSNSSKKVSVQVRALTNENLALASNIHQVFVDEVLDDRVLT